MSKLDFAKEEIGYLKMWLGVALAAGLSLAGWFMSNIATVSWYMALLTAFGFAIVVFLCYKLHKSIKRQIKRLEKL